MEPLPPKLVSTSTTATIEAKKSNLEARFHKSRTPNHRARLAIGLGMLCLQQLRHTAAPLDYGITLHETLVWIAVANKQSSRRVSKRTTRSLVALYSEIMEMKFDYEAEVGSAKFSQTSPIASGKNQVNRAKQTLAIMEFLLPVIRQHEPVKTPHPTPAEH